MSNTESLHRHPSFPTVLHRLLALCCIGIGALHGVSGAADNDVNIAPDLAGITTLHNGSPMRIERNQNPDNAIIPAFQRTSRRCPPFCIQPMRMPEGVQTIGELEMLAYLQRIGDGDKSVLVIDSRGPNWLKYGTIPGSVNIHHKKLSLRHSDEADVLDILRNRFDVERSELFLDFRDAKTLVLFCNGPWCGQSPANIKRLLRLGYPPSKLKWYRGGMQAWETLGLTTVVQP